VSALTVVGLVLAGAAFVARLLETLGIESVAGAATSLMRVLLFPAALYEVYLIVRQMGAPRASDFWWWALLLVLVWTTFLIMRMSFSERRFQMVCNVGASSTVALLAVISWLLLDDRRLPLTLSAVTAVWLVTLVVEARGLSRRSESE